MAQMAFSGSFDHSLDGKGRVIIPASFREALGEDFTITIRNTAKADSKLTFDDKDIEIVLQEDEKVEFEYGRYDYEYDINARTGKIIRWEKDAD